MKYTRDGLTLAVTAPSEAVADTLARLFSTWPDPAVEPTHDLGNLTEYNAARAQLIALRDGFQDQLDAVDPTSDPDARAKIDAAVAKRDAINTILRATARPEPL